MSSDRSDTRSRILLAARRLMDDQAQPDLRMADIARETGISRQALYLHFATRAALMIAVARDIDAELGLEEKLAESRGATCGAERLDAWIRFWGGYMPEIARAARALIRLRETDPEAAAAWDDRMAAMRDGCSAAIALIERDGRLAPPWTAATATDLLWAMLAFSAWERLTTDCGWSNADYVARMQAAARGMFLRAG